MHITVVEADIVGACTQSSRQEWFAVEASRVSLDAVWSSNLAWILLCSLGIVERTWEAACFHLHLECRCSVIDTLTKRLGNPQISVHKTDEVVSESILMRGRFCQQ